MILNAIVLAALVKLNLECDNPWLPASIFAIVGAILGLMFGYPLIPVLIGTAINLGLGFAYFWLLKRTEDSGAWWLVMILGIVGFIALGLL